MRRTLRAEVKSYRFSAFMRRTVAQPPDCERIRSGKSAEVHGGRARLKRSRALSNVSNVGSDFHFESVKYLQSEVAFYGRTREGT